MEDRAVYQVKQLDVQFWESEEDELYQLLRPLLTDTALAGARLALDGLLEIGVGVDWALVNQAVVDWAKHYSYGLVRGITETTRSFLQDEVSTWLTSGEPLQTLIDAIEPMFGVVRSEMIAVTEVTRSYAQGNMETWRESGVVDSKRWFTAEDELVCPICGALAGEVADLESGQFDIGDGEYVDGPPAHVNCRCTLQPVLETTNAG
jgi:SPP1 gp7 family putative phage head morphogenesis protein